MPFQRPGVGLTPQTAVTATATIAVDGNGEIAAVTPQVYALAVNGTLTNASSIRGGDYLWAAEATAWNGATATLQVLGQDGVTWRNLRNAANSADVTLSANGQVGLGIGQGSSLRVSVTAGSPAGFYSNLAGL
ncbi:hypothetical protein NS365_13265 [Aureimonas ureilytica]|uniref:Uncharacterized protein n=1 Tax=Aureimonas ureilytica TaxID=401562 RepID=A0A175RMF5_9HYPH|nr:hypothetical protein [Aureimonas ureilytica]KTR04995.1 hypothetical protein NS365_13265 [Aureimonas ureilytica]